MQDPEQSLQALFERRRLRAVPPGLLDRYAQEVRARLTQPPWWRRWWDELLLVRIAVPAVACAGVIVMLWTAGWLPGLARPRHAPMLAQEATAPDLLLEELLELEALGEEGTAVLPEDNDVEELLDELDLWAYNIPRRA